MAEVRFAGVRKQYGSNIVIERFDLDIKDEEFMVLVGPSGCGKSTALRMVAGLEVYERPANLFVASFIGTPPMNLVSSEVVEDGAGGLDLAAGGFRLPMPERWRAALSAGTAGKGRKVVLGVRPENLREMDRQRAGAEGPTARLAGTVEFAELLGYEVITHVRVGEDLLVAKLDPHRAPEMGDAIELLADLDGIHLFDADNEQRLGAA